MNHDIIQKLLDQIIVVKFKDWFQFRKIAIRYSFPSVDMIYWVDRIDNLVLWCQNICSHNIDQVPIPHACFFKVFTLRVKLAIAYLTKKSPVCWSTDWCTRKQISTDSGLWFNLTWIHHINLHVANSGSKVKVKGTTVSAASSWLISLVFGVSHQESGIRNSLFLNTTETWDNESILTQFSMIFQSSQ